jgi:hypothetical protein
MPKRRKSRRASPEESDLRRARELIAFLQGVVFGERQATEAEVEEAARELDKYLPALQPERVTLQ